MGEMKGMGRIRVIGGVGGIRRMGRIGELR